MAPPQSSASTASATTGAAAAPRAPQAVVRKSVPARLLAAYLRQLGARPLRTKMLTSATLFFLGDSIAQFGIEGRRLALGPSKEREMTNAGSDEAEERWDPLRCARLMFCPEVIAEDPVLPQGLTFPDGGIIFAPLAHNWLNLLQRVEYSTKLKTLAARVALDQFLWGPAVVSLFWTANGFLEGKTPSEVKDKVKLAFLPAYTKSVMVFGPTAIVNFAFVPLQHRLLVGQTVGLGWNTWLSYINHVNNKHLAAAAAELQSAQALELVQQAAHPEVDPAPAHVDVERAQAAIERAQRKKEKIRGGEGGGATGVGTRMGY